MHFVFLLHLTLESAVSTYLLQQLVACYDTFSQVVCFIADEY